MIADNRTTKRERDEGGSGERDKSQSRRSGSGKERDGKDRKIHTSG